MYKYKFRAESNVWQQSMKNMERFAYFIIVCFVIYVLLIEASVESFAIQPRTNGLRSESLINMSFSIWSDAASGSHHYSSFFMTPVDPAIVKEFRGTNENINDVQISSKKTNSVEDWCVIWYLGAFGSLVCFFLVLTCTELFYGNPLYRQHNLNAFIQNVMAKRAIPETPPPPYHLFAPPSYIDSIQKIDNEKVKGSDVFVVPVHRLAANLSPPKYDEVVQKNANGNQKSTVTFENSISPC